MFIQLEPIEEIFLARPERTSAEGGGAALA